MSWTCDVGVYKAAQRIAAGLGLEVSAIDDRAERVPSDSLRAAWQAITTATSEDPWYVARSAMSSDIEGGITAVMYACGTKATLGDGLETLTRYYRLINDAVEIRLSHEGDTGMITRADRGESTSSFAEAQFALGFVLLCCRRMASRRVTPREVWFRHVDPKIAADAGAAIFDCPVRMGRSIDALVFDDKTLATPLRRAEEALSRVLDQAVTAALAILPEVRDEPIVDAVRRDLALHLAHDSSLDALASRLAMHKRTLQRRLKEAGTSHKDVLDDLRRSIAERHVRAGELSLTEVAFLLGFSEPAVFTRAFKGWYGVAPSKMRTDARL